MRIDPRQRYPTAAEMGRAIEEGAKGVDPGSGTAIVPRVHRGGGDTTVIDGPDDRTRRVEVHEPGTRVAVVTPRAPRQGEPRRAAAPLIEAAPARTGRLVALAVGLVIVIGAVVAIVLALQPSTGVHLQHGPYSHDPQALIIQLSTLIANNTG